MIKWVSTIILIAVVSTMIYAETKVFKPGPSIGKDSYVNEIDLWSDSNFGESCCIYINRCGGWDCRKWGYIDFIKLHDYIGKIELYSACLTIWCFYQDNPPADGYVHRAVGKWEEDTITWNNQPGYDENGPCSVFLAEDDDVRIDVTDIVDSWVEEEYPCYGFVIRTESYQNTYNYQAKSSDYDDHPEQWPELTIEFDYADIEPTSLGEIKSLMK